MELMQKRNLAWVIYQKTVNIIKPLVFGEEYDIKTIITGKDRVFTYRDFHVSQGDDKFIECATSWLLFDLNERQFLRTYPEDLNDLVAGLENNGHLARPPKLRKAGFESLEFRYLKEVRFSDLDSNNHISNAQLVSNMVDAIDHEYLESNLLTGFNIQYMQEVKLGEKIGFESIRRENKWSISARVTDKTVALAEFNFKK